MRSPLRCSRPGAAFPLRPTALRVAAGQCARRPFTGEHGAREEGLECARSSRVSSPRRPRSSWTATARAVTPEQRCQAYQLAATGADLREAALPRLAELSGTEVDPACLDKAGEALPAAAAGRRSDCAAPDDVVRRWARRDAQASGGGGRSRRRRRSPALTGRWKTPRSRPTRPGRWSAGLYQSRPCPTPDFFLLVECDTRIGAERHGADLSTRPARPRPTRLAADTLRAGWTGSVDRVTGEWLLTGTVDIPGCLADRVPGRGRVSRPMDASRPASPRPAGARAAARRCGSRPPSASASSRVRGDAMGRASASGPRFDGSPPRSDPSRRRADVRVRSPGWWEICNRAPDGPMAPRDQPTSRLRSQAKPIFGGARTGPGRPSSASWCSAGRRWSASVMARVYALSTLALAVVLPRLRARRAQGALPAGARRQRGDDGDLFVRERDAAATKGDIRCSRYAGGDLNVVVPVDWIDKLPFLYFVVPIVPVVLLAVVGFNQSWWRMFLLEAKLRAREWRRPPSSRRCARASTRTSCSTA